MTLTLSYAAPDAFVVHASGDVCHTEALEMIRQIGADARLNGRATILVDARGVTGVPKTGELRVLALALRPLFDGGVRGVAIVTDGTFIYGVARMFSVFAEAVDVKVGAFRDFGEATQWLDEQMLA